MSQNRGGEFGLIRWIRERSAKHPRASIGIGDDCSALRFSGDRAVLATTDMLMDGRHFQLQECGPESAGYKALGVNLSDIAAMAGLPVAALVSVALPRARAAEIAQSLHSGMAPLVDRFGLVLAGGDTNAWEGPLVISITVLGEATERGPVGRSGARPGDAVLVTGPLGGSLLGRHLRPEPRIDAALKLAESATLHALIDLSDGLASDLGHILQESGGLGAILEADLIPIHADAQRLAALDGRPALDHALADGEDFELCLVVAPEDADRLLDRPPDGVHLHRVGWIEEGSGLRLQALDGSLAPISLRGFDHFRFDAEGGPADAG
ncbi:thiamine-phosphate kinase [soil metagenome]